MTEPPESPQPHRRLAWAPTIVAVACVAVAAVFGIVVAGLASSRPAEPSPSPSASTGIPAPVDAAPTPSASGRPAAGPNECVDARGDGTGVDLDSIALSVDGDALRAVFVLTEPLPDGKASLELYAEGADARYQLAASWSDGELDEFFAYRLPTEVDSDDDEDDSKRPGEGNGSEGDDSRGSGNDRSRDERSELPKRDILNEGTVVVALVPADVLDDLGDSFFWYAYATAENEPADSCYLPDGTLVPFRR